MVTIQVVTSYGYYPSGYILWLHPSGYILWLLSKWLHPMVTIQVVTSYGYYPSGYILWLLSKWLQRGDGTMPTEKAVTTRLIAEALAPEGQMALQRHRLAARL